MLKNLSIVLLFLFIISCSQKQEKIINEITSPNTKNKNF
jgi:hypothetical protein